LVASASAGPWTRRSGEGYAKLSLSILRTDGFRDAAGRFNDGARYSSLTTALYAELGVLRDLHLQAYVPVLRGRNGFRNGPSRAFFCGDGTRISNAVRSSLGDGIFGIQFSPGLAPFAHALRLETKMPLYDPTAPGGACGPLFPQPGDGQVDVSALVSAGVSPGSGKWFAFTELGHRHRTEWYLWGTTGRMFADTFVAHAQMGFELQRDEFLMLATRLELPYRDDSVSRGSWLIAPTWAMPVAPGVALELELGFVPWARNAAVGELRSLFWTQLTAGISARF